MNDLSRAQLAQFQPQDLRDGHAVLALIGVIGLTQTPSNLVCSGMAMSLPLYLALRAWRKETR
jgi:hypothetical protein